MRAFLHKSTLDRVYTLCIVKFGKKLRLSILLLYNSMNFNIIIEIHRYNLFIII